MRKIKKNVKRNISPTADLTNSFAMRGLASLVSYLSLGIQCCERTLKSEKNLPSVQPVEFFFIFLKRTKFGKIM